MGLCWMGCFGLSYLGNEFGSLNSLKLVCHKYFCKPIWKRDLAPTQ